MNTEPSCGSQPNRPLSAPLCCLPFCYCRSLVRAERADFLFSDGHWGYVRKIGKVMDRQAEAEKSIETADA